MFIPHKFNTTIYGCPTIHITEQAAEDMYHLAQLVDMEVGWLCTMTREGRKITIDGVYLPDQECHQATTELTPDGLAKLGQKLIEEDLKADIKPDNPKFRANRLKCWGH